MSNRSALSFPFNRTAAGDKTWPWGMRLAGGPPTVHLGFLEEFTYLCILLLVALGLHCCAGFSLVVASMGPRSSCGAWASRGGGYTWCAAWALGAQKLQLPGSKAQARQLWFMGPAVPWHVGSSQIRDWTHVSCIGRWIPIHCATREAWVLGFWSAFSFLSWYSHIHSPKLLDSPVSWGHSHRVRVLN